MSATKITVNNNGSLKVKDDFEIVDKNGNPYNLMGREIVSICRCGPCRTISLSAMDRTKDILNMMQ